MTTETLDNFAITAFEKVCGRSAFNTQTLQCLQDNSSTICKECSDHFNPEKCTVTIPFIGKNNQLKYYNYPTCDQTGRHEKNLEKIITESSIYPNSPKTGTDHNYQIQLYNTPNKNISNDDICCANFKGDKCSKPYVTESNMNMNMKCRRIYYPSYKRIILFVLVFIITSIVILKIISH